jgi:hypothetical protein
MDRELEASMATGASNDLAYCLSGKWPRPSERALPIPQRRAGHRPGCDRGRAGFGLTEFSGVWAYTPLVEYKEISTLVEIEALAHQETPQEDALALIEYLKNGEIALDLVAEKLFEGNQVRAFIAALFAGTKIKMHQDEFYGNIQLAALQFLSDTSSHNS